MLGLAITDQFIGAASDRYLQVQSIFQGLRDPYEQLYYTGLLHETARQDPAHGRLRPAHSFAVSGRSHALLCAKRKKFGSRNDDSILRWNRCVDCWKAVSTFISSADPQLLIRRICAHQFARPPRRPSLRLRAIS